MIKSNLTNKVSDNSKYFYLLGDKAYKTQEELKLNDKIVKSMISDKEMPKI